MRELKDGAGRLLWDEGFGEGSGEVNRVDDYKNEVKPSPIGIREPSAQAETELGDTPGCGEPDFKVVHLFLLAGRASVFVESAAEPSGEELEEMRTKKAMQRRMKTIIFIELIK